MSDEQKRAILDRVLSLAPANGFTPSVLTEALRGADASLFPNGIVDVIAFWSGETDRALAAALKDKNLLQLSMRKRIREGVLTRLSLLRPYKEAARKATIVLAYPQHVGLGAELIWHSADVIWRAAGDLSTDFNYYTKRGILVGVLSSTLVAWFGDDSEDETATSDFLDARIDNVMEFEKLKARVKEACGTTGEKS